MREDALKIQVEIARSRVSESRMNADFEQTSGRAVEIGVDLFEWIGLGDKYPFPKCW
jgi:hypothetical protein